MKSKQAIAALSALSQETRLAIFRHLVAAGPEGKPAGRIATHLKVAPRREQTTRTLGIPQGVESAQFVRQRPKVEHARIFTAER